MNRPTPTQQVAAWLCGGGLLLLALGYRGTQYLPPGAEEEKATGVLRTPGTGDRRRATPRENVQTLDPARETTRPDPRGGSAPYWYEGAAALAVGTAAILIGLVVWFRGTTASERHRWIHANDDA